MSHEERSPVTIDVARGPDAVVALAGELDAGEVVDLRQRVVQAIDESGRPRVVVDWSRLSITDPASLAALLAVAEELERTGHRVVMVGPPEQPPAAAEHDEPLDPAPALGSVRRRTLAPGSSAVPGKLPPDLASDLISELFSVGLELTAAQALVGPGDVRRRLDGAIGDLDSLIRRLRDAAAGSGPPAR